MKQQIQRQTIQQSRIKSSRCLTMPTHLWKFITSSLQLRLRRATRRWIATEQELLRKICKNQIQHHNIRQTTGQQRQCRSQGFRNPLSILIKSSTTSPTPTLQERGRERARPQVRERERMREPPPLDGHPILPRNPNLSTSIPLHPSYI